MKLDSLTRNSLAPYLPIPDGRVILALYSAVLTTVVFLAGTLCYVIWFSGTKMSLTEHISVVLGIALTIGISVVTFKAFGNHPAWLMSIVDRNVRGYELWCIRNLDGDPTVSYEVHRRGHKPPVRDGTETIISVPLLEGTRGRVWSTKVGNIASWWSVRLHCIVFDHVSGVPLIEMRDPHGHGFTVIVKHALRIIASERSARACDKLTNAPGSAGLLIDGLITRLDKAEAKLAAERADRDAAVAELHEAARRISATKRFGRSTQAGEIRAWLDERLKEHEAVRPVVLPGQIDC